MGIDDLIKGKREDILRIAAKHGAYNVRIFGSFARGDAGPESDVNLLVDAGANTSSWFPAGLKLDLEELLGRYVRIATEKGLYWYIKARVMEEAIPL